MIPCCNRTYKKYITINENGEKMIDKSFLDTIKDNEYEFSKEFPFFQKKKNLICTCMCHVHGYEIRH